MSHAFCFKIQILRSRQGDIENSESDNLSFHIGEFGSETFAASMTDFSCASVLLRKCDANIELKMLAILLGPQSINSLSPVRFEWNFR